MKGLTRRAMLRRSAEYSHDSAVQKAMALESAEEWTAPNATGGRYAHLNPFFVIHFNGRELAANDVLVRWQDMIGTPPQNDGAHGTVAFKTRFESFRGKLLCIVMFNTMKIWA